ncbi:MAG: hypothetical protein SF028_08045 [Candidatus Sumerlaeia bacterium]|nr:hypothetical protein [Candidatus Sumerlaeia bacterium]
MSFLPRHLAALLLLALPAFPLADPGYSVVRDDAGRFWFEGPDRERFLSVGVCAIDSGGWRPPAGSIFYGGPDGEPFRGDVAAWRASTIEILRRGAFNTLGAWSNPQLNDGTLFATPNLYIITAEPDRLANLLRPGLEELMRKQVREAMATHAHPDRILGFFLDNEMAWYGPSPWTIRANSTLLEAMLGLAADDPARKGAINFLASRYQGDPSLMAASWGIPVTRFESLSKELLETSTTPDAISDREEFTARMAERFFSTARKVVSEEAPGKLLLGVRFAGSAPLSVLRECGKHCDVVSLNVYRARPDADERLLSHFWLETRKPLMVTEFSWRATINNSGNPNLRGAGGVVRTQAERAANYQAFVSDHFQHPQIIGMHWFAWADQSPQGRFDGENSNYGIVDIFHRPYEELVTAMFETNRRAIEVHGASTRSVPTELPAPPAVVVAPGQFPDRPASLDILALPPVRAHEPFMAPDATFALTPKDRGAFVLRAQTGNDWGGGVTLYGPAARATGRPGAGFATDLDGYSTLVLDLESAKRISIEVVLDEAGVAPPGAVSYESGNGDDGESFAWGPREFGPGRVEIRLPLADLGSRTVWGNQDGKRFVDLAALKGPSLVVGGSQGEVEITLHSVRFEK